MPDYTVTFDAGSPSWNLYQRLKKDGVKDDDLDTGYPETNYVNKTRTIVHKGDHKIEAAEVLDYALEHYERYQLAIKEMTGYVVPWSLDDLNPATDFDAKIREQIDRAASIFGRILASKGLKTGTDSYNELLAVSLNAFTLCAKPKGTSKARVPAKIRQELAREGLTEVLDYLAANGGLAVAKMNKDCDLEASALQALAKGCGACTEQSNILYAVLRRAGLKVKFVFVGSSHVISKKYSKKEGADHISVSLVLNNRTRMFDPRILASNAEPFYKKVEVLWWYEQTTSEYLAVINNNLGDNYAGKGQLATAMTYNIRALQINPQFGPAHNSLGNAYADKGQPGLAREEFQKAIDLDPNDEVARYNLGNVFMAQRKTGLAIASFKKAVAIDPDFTAAHYNLGLAYLAGAREYKEQDEIEKALGTYLKGFNEVKKSYELGQWGSDEGYDEMRSEIELLGGEIPPEQTYLHWKVRPEKQSPWDAK